MARTPRLDELTRAPVPNRTLWLALVTLAELVDQVRDGPARPTTAIRLALAVCHQHSNGDLEPFVGFWRTMQKSWDAMSNPQSASYCRSTYLRTSLRGVLRAVGIEPNAEIEIALDSAARKAIAARLASDPASEKSPSS